MCWRLTCFRSSCFILDLYIVTHPFAGRMFWRLPSIDPLWRSTHPTSSLFVKNVLKILLSCLFLDKKRSKVFCFSSSVCTTSEDVGIAWASGERTWRKVPCHFFLKGCTCSLCNQGSCMASVADGRVSGSFSKRRLIKRIALGLVRSHAGEGNFTAPSCTMLYVSFSVPALKGGNPQSNTYATTPIDHMSALSV